MPSPLPEDLDETANDGADRWTVADLIDLEHYLGADESTLREQPAARQVLTERDRSLYLDAIAPAVAPAQPHSAEHRRRSLLYWLRARRAAEDPEQRLLLPGSTFAQAQRLATLALITVGFLLGVGAASALLSYDGHRPINVTWYIFLLVVVQLLLIATVLGAWLVRRSRSVGRTVQDLTLLGRLIRPLIMRINRWLQQQRLGHGRRELRDQSAAQIGRLRSQYALYGPVSYLPALIPAQVFGVAFNLGVILTTIALEWFTDLAFGWGSALDLSPQFIYDLVRTFAWPWGWLFGEGVGYPTLDQIAGSRINLKDPLFLLDASHLRSWRWFLVLSVFTYGLLPRLLLLAASVITQRHLLERLPFTQGRIQALYARLLTPTVETATHGSGHGPEMPIPAPIAHRGPVATPIAWSATPTPVAKSPSSPTAPPADAAAVTLSAETQAQPVARVPDSPTPPKQPVAPSPIPEPAPAPGATQVPESTKEGRVPVPYPESEPELEANPEPKPEAEAEPEPEPEAVPASERDPASTAEPGFEPQPQPERIPDREPKPLPSSGDAAPGGIAADACLLLIQLDVDEIIEDQDRPRLASLLARLAGWRVAASASFGSGRAMTAGVVNWVAEQRWQAPPARVAIIMDGSQPPITENLGFLRELRAAAGTQAQILLALVGDPQDDDALPPVRTFDFIDWQRKIDQLADPYLRLEMLVPASDAGGA